jgi:hypothetical protein
LTEESRLTVRLWMKLEEFDFKLIHRAGIHMTPLDALGWYDGGATVVVPKNNKLKLDTHDMFKHCG